MQVYGMLPYAYIAVRVGKDVVDNAAQLGKINTKPFIAHWWYFPHLSTLLELCIDNVH